MLKELVLIRLATYLCCDCVVVVVTLWAAADEAPPMRSPKARNPETAMLVLFRIVSILSW
jgi:hypothetical protein